MASDTGGFIRGQYNRARERVNDVGWGQASRECFGKFCGLVVGEGGKKIIT